MIVLEYASYSIKLNIRTFRQTTLDLKINHRRTMAGTLRTFRRTPCTKMHTLETTMLTYTKYRDLVAFVKAAQGKRVKLTDEDDTIKIVYITNQTEISRNTRNRRTCQLILEEI